MSAVDLRAARERLTRAAYAVARGDHGATDEHEKAAIALVRVLDGPSMQESQLYALLQHYAGPAL